MNFARVDTSSLAPLHRAVVRFLQFVGALWDQIGHDKVIIRASGLAYSSLLATVPLVAVLFALFSAFGALDDLQRKVQELLFTQFLPTRQDEFVAYVDRFIDNTRGLGFVGFVVLIVAAILLLDNIESNFNEIWHARIRRKFINKLTAYTSVLVFGTVLIGVSLSISAKIKAMLFSSTALELSALTKLGSWVFPLFSSFLAFLLMFLIIPSGRVKVRSAAVGALFTSVAWELGKNVFANSVGQSVRYSTIYGSIAAIPIFLIWLYVTWIIVLIGLEIAYTHQNFTALIRSRAAENADCRDRLSIAVKLFTVIAQRFDGGSDPPNCDELADDLGVPLNEVEELVGFYSGSGLVREVVTGTDNAGLAPSTSLDRIMLSDVVRAIFKDSHEPSPGDSPLDQAVDSAIGDFQHAGHAAIRDVNFQQFLARFSDGERDG
jgi:membrane protein